MVPPHGMRRFLRTSDQIGLWLFVYSILIFGLAFLVPYVIPALKLIAPLSLEERSNAATQFLVLSQTVLTSVLVLIIGAAVFSIYLTYRLVRAVSRLEQSAKEVGQGNLTLRIPFKEGDHLHELSERVNGAMTNLEQAFVEIRGREVSGRAAVREVLDEIKAHPSVHRETLERLELALKDGERIDEVLKRFRLPDGP